MKKTALLFSCLFCLFFSFGFFSIVSAQVAPVSVPITCTRTGTITMTTNDCDGGWFPIDVVTQNINDNVTTIGPFKQECPEQCPEPHPEVTRYTFSYDITIHCVVDTSGCENGTAYVDIPYKWSFEKNRAQGDDQCYLSAEIASWLPDDAPYGYNINPTFSVNMLRMADYPQTGDINDCSGVYQGQDSLQIRDASTGFTTCVGDGYVDLRFVSMGTYGNPVECSFTSKPSGFCTPRQEIVNYVCRLGNNGWEKWRITENVNGTCNTQETMVELCGQDGWADPAYYSCDCSGYDCLIKQRWFDKGCRVEEGMANCYSEPEDRVIETCPPPETGLSYCYEGNVHENVSYYNCTGTGEPNSRPSCPITISSTLKDTCGDCAFIHDPYCCTTANGSGICKDQVCTTCQGATGYAECVYGSPAPAMVLNCGPPSTVEFSWCAKPQFGTQGVNCTYTANYPGTCGPNVVCTAPTIDIVCDGVCDAGSGDSIPDDLLPDDLIPDDLTPDDLIPPDGLCPDDVEPELDGTCPTCPDGSEPFADDVCPDDIADDIMPIPDDSVPDDIIPDDIVPEPDDLIPDDLTPDDDFPKGDEDTYNICYGKICLSIPNYGVPMEKICNNQNDCLNLFHYECNTYKQCVKIEKPGLNTCLSSPDCIEKTHTECNLRGQCVVASGVGIDSCKENLDCQNTSHTECGLNEVCQVVYKPGENTCFYNSDCVGTHNTCNRIKQCVVVSGSGDDLCYTNGDCLNNSHNECDGSQCIVVEGRGIDSCVSNSDCLNSSHKECALNGQCLSVFGPGFDTCTTSCATHNECNIQKQCVVVAGEGDDLCNDNADCQEGKYHNECNVRNQCVAVPGEGVDRCINICDCQNGRHSECTPWKTCTTIYGIGGISTCTYSSDCTATHNKCVLDKCEVINGIGVDACYGPDPDSFCINDTDNHRNVCMTDDSCVDMPGEEGQNDCNVLGANSIDCQEDKYHNECNHLNQCVVVAGAATDECQTNANCVDQNNPPEAYELNVSRTSSDGYCMGIGGLFSWKYKDTDLDHEIRFILEIDDDSGFGSPVRKVVSGIYYTSESTNQQLIYVVSPGRVVNDDSINYNTAYYWRVKVSDEHGLDSAWTYFNGNGNNGTTDPVSKTSYTFTGHSAPSTEFIAPTIQVDLNEEIDFDDKSICYSNFDAYSCFEERTDNGYNDYNWWFGDGAAAYTLPADRTELEDVSHIGDVSHTYTETSTGVTLQVCDELGQCCGISHPLKFKGKEGGGTWKEISPF